jgi:hypothetical protein
VRDIWIRTRARSWFKNLQGLAEEYPKVWEDFVHYLDTGELPDNPKMWPIIEDYEICQKLEGESGKVIRPPRPDFIIAHATRPPNLRLVAERFGAAQEIT